MREKLRARVWVNNINEKLINVYPDPTSDKGKDKKSVRGTRGSKQVRFCDSFQRQTGEKKQQSESNAR